MMRRSSETSSTPGVAVDAYAELPSDVALEPVGVIDEPVAELVAS